MARIPFTFQEANRVDFQSRPVSSVIVNNRNYLPASAMTSASDAMEILAKQEISRNEFKDFIRDLTSSESSLKKGRNIVLERRRHFDG